MFFKTCILILLSCHFFILTMAGASSSGPSPEATWRHMRNFIEKKGEFAEEPMQEYIIRHLDIYLFATHMITIITKKYTKKRNVGRSGEEA